MDGFQISSSVCFFVGLKTNKFIDCGYFRSSPANKNRLHELNVPYAARSYLVS